MAAEETPFSEMDFNVGYSEMEAMPDGREKALQYIVSALLSDELHHKQWCVEKALEALGGTLEGVRAKLPDYHFEDGIAP